MPIIMDGYTHAGWMGIINVCITFHLRDFIHDEFIKLKVT